MCLFHCPIAVSSVLLMVKYNPNAMLSPGAALKIHNSVDTALSTVAADGLAASLNMVPQGVFQPSMMKYAILSSLKRHNVYFIQSEFQ